jgi:hypothetical protein
LLGCHEIGVDRYCVGVAYKDVAGEFDSNRIGIGIDDPRSRLEFLGNLTGCWRQSFATPASSTSAISISATVEYSPTRTV